LKVPYRKIVIEFLNTIFGSDQGAHHWWRMLLPYLLERDFSINSFSFHFNSSEKFDWRGEVYAFAEKNGREFLFDKIGNNEKLIIENTVSISSITIHSTINWPYLYG
jgi:hypothetical protein